jgi:hypothetical protein
MVFESLLALGLPSLALAECFFHLPISTTWILTPFRKNRITSITRHLDLAISDERGRNEQPAF